MAAERPSKDGDDLRQALEIGEAMLVIMAACANRYEFFVTNNHGATQSYEAVLLDPYNETEPVIVEFERDTLAGALQALAALIASGGHEREG